MTVVPLPETDLPAANCPVNDRVWGVVKELQYRQSALLNIKRQEFYWKLFFWITCCASILGVFASKYAQPLQQMFPLWLLILLLFSNCIILFRLHLIQAKLQKAAVNFGVIKHHLTGIMEVGLCSCNSDCDCTEQFKRKVLQDFGISLY